jgi:putative transposase
VPHGSATHGSRYGLCSCHDHRASAQVGPGGARGVVPSPRGRKGGAGRRSRSRRGRLDRGRWLRRRHDQGGGFSLGHPQTRRQRRHGPAGGIPQGPPRRLQHHEQDVQPWLGLALVDPEQPSLHHLEGRGVQVGQATYQPILGRRQRTVLISGLPADRARLPIEAPLGHVGVKGGLKRRDQAPTLLQGQTGQIPHLERAGREVDEASIPHRCGLLSLAAQDIINRNKLYSSQLEEVFHRRKRPVWRSWRMDETYIRVKGEWRYLYRAVDTHGQTIDFLLTEQRDQEAALRFLKKAIRRHGVPEKITIDGSAANEAAIQHYNQEHGTLIEIRQIKYLNNIVEQDHRGVKRVTRPMLGFKSFEAAQATLAGIELMHMLKKGQLVGETRAAGLTPAEHFYSLVA